MDSCPFCCGPLACRVLTLTYAEQWCGACRRVVTPETAWDAWCQARARERFEAAAIVAVAVEIVAEHQRHRPRR